MVRDENESPTAPPKFSDFRRHAKHLFALKNDELFSPLERQRLVPRDENERNPAADSPIIGPIVPL